MRAAAFTWAAASGHEANEAKFCDEEQRVWRVRAAREARGWAHTICTPACAKGKHMHSIFPSAVPDFPLCVGASSSSTGSHLRTTMLPSGAPQGVVAEVVVVPLPKEHADGGAVGGSGAEGGGGEMGELRLEEGRVGSGASANTSPEEEVRRRRQEELQNPNNSLNLHFRSFEVGEKLGEGGFGSVYRVKLRKNGALVALKIVLLDSLVTFETFLEVACNARLEYSRIKQLQHPNIVLGFECTYARIPGYVRSTLAKRDSFCFFWWAFDLLWLACTNMLECEHVREIEVDVDPISGPSIRGPFALMIFGELCAQSLKDFMKKTERGIINAERGKPLLCRWLFEIIDALAFMHSQEVIHHDMKPDNVLLSDDLHVRITDFGIAAHTQAGEAGGTPAFLPPEVIPGVARKVNDTKVAGLHPSKKETFSTGVTAYLMLRKAGGDDSTTYHNDTWYGIAGERMLMGQISENEKETLLAQELSHLSGSEAMRMVSGMLKMDWQQRSFIQDVRRHLLRFLHIPDSLFCPSAAVSAEDIDETKYVIPAVPVSRIDFQPRHWLLSVCVWALRLTPLSALSALVVWRFVVESDDDDVQKGQNELQRMVAATTAALVFAAFVASITSACLVRVEQTLALRYILIILVIIGTGGIGWFHLKRDVEMIGYSFILYAISQFFTMLSVYLTNEFEDLQKCSNIQLQYCNTKLLENLTRFELFGLITPTLVFQLGILYAGITVVQGLPRDPWEVIFLAAVCWLVNLPRYLAHFSLVRAMTNAINLCQRVGYIEMLRQVLENVNSILAWSLLAVQQPFWSVLEMMACTMQTAGAVLIGCGVCTGPDDDDDEERNPLSCACTCVGVAVVTTATLLIWLFGKLSTYCSKFPISMLAYDVKLGGGNNNCWSVVDRLKSYGKESELGVRSLLFLANKSISSSNNANFCILVGCLSAIIANTIDEQAALYGYLAGYLACSTVLEVQSSMFHWFLAVLGSGDLNICPEVRDASHPCTCRCACLMLKACSLFGAGDEHGAHGTLHHQRQIPKDGTRAETV